jgi:pyruvate dehydrogenase E1 component
MQQALGAQAILGERYGVAVEVWSATSYQLLRNQALDVDRWNLMHPGQTPRTPLVAELLGEAAGSGPIVAVSDWIRAWPDMISRWIPGGAWTSLGTDGFGRSDSREALRRFFGIDTAHIVVAVLSELARCGQVSVETAREAMAEQGVDPEAPFSLTH